MADVKITALTAISANPVNPATFPMPMVDLLDTSMAASGTTKKVTVNQILGAGGTATLASATITGAATVGTTLGVTGVSTLASAVVTGDLTVDTSTLKVDSTNDRVGIGTATPSNQLHVKSTSSTPALIETSGGALTYLQFTSTTGSAYIGNNANGLGFYTTGSADLRMSLAAAGDLSITSGNVVMGTSGKGIDFSATASGSGTMTSELLNDYEEGTWTGTLAGGTTNPTTPVTATGRYTKVGRQVSVQIAFEAVSNVGASGSISITGLPFANAALRVIGAAGAFTGATFSGTLISQIESSASSILFYGVISNSAWTAATHNPSAGTFFWANLTYSV